MTDNPAKADVKGAIEHPAEPECDHNYEDAVIDGAMARHCGKCGDTYGAVAEPVIEVAPGEYERCAVPAQEAPRVPTCGHRISGGRANDTCFRKATYRVSAKDEATYPDLYKNPFRCTQHMHKLERTPENRICPAVPAQEAPRDKYPENCPLCKRGDHYAWAFTECPSETTKDGAESLKAEPQAGAQPDTHCDSCDIGPEGHEFDCPEAQQ